MIYTLYCRVMLLHRSTCRQAQQTCHLPLVCTHPGQPSFASYRSGSTGTRELTSDIALSCVALCQKYRQIQLSRKNSSLVCCVHEHRNRRGIIVSFVQNVSDSLKHFGITVSDADVITFRVILGNVMPKTTEYRQQCESRNAFQPVVEENTDDELVN